MPRRSKSRSHRADKYSRTLVIKPQSNTERDLILELGLPLTEELEVFINTIPGRIELELRGEYNEVDHCLNQLRKLEQDISSALYPDRDGNYRYSADIIAQLCKPPVNLDLFSAGISVFGFASTHLNDSLLSEAPLEDVISIHHRIVSIRDQILGDFNRDIERFFIIIALTINSDELDQIIDTSIKQELIKATEYGYQFTMAQDEARTKLLDILGIDIGDALVFHEDQDMSDIDLGSLGFNGGKIVFFKDGKEIEPDDVDV